jgi:AcrR family transcriptional regulator
MSTTADSSIGALREQRRAEVDKGRVDTRQAILNALEEILTDSALHEVSVAHIVERAGISRKAFYSYFESKYEAAGAALGQVMDRMYERWLPFVEKHDDDPLATLQDVLSSSFMLWSEHHALARALHEYWQAVPEIGDQWLTAIERFTVGVAAAIDRARAAGALPPGIDSRRAAAAGLWTGEQLMYVMRSGRSPEFPDLDAVYEAYVNAWAGLLYRPQPDRMVTRRPANPPGQRADP